LPQTDSRLYWPAVADYAVRQGAPWKKDVWRTASEPQGSRTPRRCAKGLARHWRIPTTRADARATAVPPAAATSWSSSAMTAPPTIGRWLASSSATCAWMTICRSATLVPLVMCHRRVRCATCSIRPSIRFDRWRRRSRSDATRPPGWTSSAISPGSTSKARSTAGRTTGPSGAGIASALAKTNARASKPPDRPSDPAHLNHQAVLLLSVRTGRSAGQPLAHHRAVLGVSVRMPLAREAQVDNHAVRVRMERAVRRREAHAPRAQAAPTNAVHGRAHPIQARGLHRSTVRRGGP